MTSLSFAMMGAGILAGILYNRAGPRALCIAAALILTAGYYMMTKLGTGTTAEYIVLSLALIGFGLGLLVTPAANMIMNMVSKKQQGMVSSLTSLERFAPLTLGIAFFNLIFIRGVLALAAGAGVTLESPAELKIPVLAAGFDHAFFYSFLVGIIIIALALVVRQEIHLDYKDSAGTEPGMGMI
jgi:MFS family permease